MADLQPWAMLSCEMPTEPARHWMAVWRKLKAPGAVCLNNGVCVLPTSSERVRRIRRLAPEITEEMGGDAVVLEAAVLDPGQHERRETAAGKLAYAELEENDKDLKKPRTWPAKIATLDYYGASLAKEALERLQNCERLLEVFGEQVFEAQLENKPAPAGKGRREP